jgi:hypothetical protein
MADTKEKWGIMPSSAFFLLLPNQLQASPACAKRTKRAIKTTPHLPVKTFFLTAKLLQQRWQNFF